MATSNGKASFLPSTPGLDGARSFLFLDDRSSSPRTPAHTGSSSSGASAREGGTQTATTANKLSSGPSSPSAGRSGPSQPRLRGLFSSSPNPNRDEETWDTVVADSTMASSADSSTDGSGRSIVLGQEAQHPLDSYDPPNPRASARGRPKALERPAPNSRGSRLGALLAKSGAASREPAAASEHEALPAEQISDRSSRRAVASSDSPSTSSDGENVFRTAMRRERLPALSSAAGQGAVTSASSGMPLSSSSPISPGGAWQGSAELPSQTSPNASAAAEVVKERGRAGSVAAMAARWGGSALKESPPPQPPVKSSTSPLTPPPRPERSQRDTGRLGATFGLARASRSNKSRSKSRELDQADLAQALEDPASPLSATRAKPTQERDASIGVEPILSAFTSKADQLPAQQTSPDDLSASPKAGLGISSPRRALNRTASHGDLISAASEDAYAGSSATQFANGDVSSSSAGDVISPGAARKAQAMYARDEDTFSASSASNSSPAVNTVGRGRLSRLQYNKADRLSIVGDNRGWDHSSQRSGAFGTAAAFDAARPPLARRESAMSPESARQDGNYFDSSTELTSHVNQDGHSYGLAPHHRQTRSVSSAARTAQGEHRLSTAPHRELLLPALTSVRSAEGPSALSRQVSSEYGTLQEPKSSAANVLAHAREDLQLANGSGLEGDDEPSPSTTGTTSASRHGRWSQRSHNTSMGGSSDGGGSLTSPGTSIGAHRLSQTARHSAQSGTNAPTALVRPSGATTSAPVEDQQPPLTPGLSDIGAPPSGTLTDKDIAELGAVPGISAASLLNANGAPLSSKSVLTIALQKAQSAVVMDSDNNVPEAIAAYKQAVRLLQEVMDRIAPNRSRKNKSSREEERRRLRVIHDTYAERIRLLSLLYEPDDGTVSTRTEDGESSPQRSTAVQGTEASPGKSNKQAGARSSVTFPRRREHDNDSPLLDGGLQRERDGALQLEDSADSSRDSAHSSLKTPSIAIQTELGQYDRRRRERRESQSDQEVLVENGGAPASNSTQDSEAQRDRSDSESSFRSAVATGSAAPSTALRVPDIGRSGAAVSASLEEELKTPVTPYFDVDPHLNVDESHALSLPSRSSLDNTSHRGQQTTTQRMYGHQAAKGSRATGSLSVVNQGLVAQKPPSRNGTAMERRSSSEGNALAAVNAAAGLSSSAFAAPRADGLHQPGADNLSTKPALKQPELSTGSASTTQARADSAQPRLLVSPSVARGTISQRRQKAPQYLDVVPAQSRSPTSSNASLSGNSLLATPTMEALTFFDGRRQGSEKSSSSPKMERALSGLQGPYVPSPPNSGGQLDSAGRKRAASQPGNRRPPLPAQFLQSNGESMPPMPRMARKSSMPGSPGGALAPAGAASGLRAYANANAAHAAATQRLHPLSRTVSAGRSPSADDRVGFAAGRGRKESSMVSHLFTSTLHSAARGSPSFASGTKVTVLPWLGVGGGPAESSIAPPVPADPSLRPFHLMRQLHLSIVKGAFVTRKLYVPKELWTQQGTKLSSLESKVRVLLLITSAVQGLETMGEPLLKPIGDQPGLLVAQGARFAKQLEEFDALLVEAQNNVAKKLSYIETMAGKKSSGLGSFGTKLTRGLDRMTNGGKGVDSPATYVEALSRTFSRSQVLGSHLLAVQRAEGRSIGTQALAAPSSEAYAALPAELRVTIEAKLKRAADFFTNVVIRIAVHDVQVLSERLSKRAHAALVE